jgi:hypothetical protein
MSYVDAIIEIPFAPAGVTMADIYQLLSDELGNGISEISEESVINRQGKHKKFIIEVTCRSHSSMMNETRADGLVNRCIEYKNKKSRLRLWIRKC